MSGAFFYYSKGLNCFPETKTEYRSEMGRILNIKFFDLMTLPLSSALEEGVFEVHRLLRIETYNDVIYEKLIIIH